VEEQMSRKIGIAALIFLGGLVGYNFITTGTLTLVPGSSASPEEQRLADLEAQVRSAGSQITSASRAAGVSGMDSTADVEHAINELERVEKEIEAVKEKTKSSAVREKCDRLLSESRSMRGAR
jgi:hypothetical protein